MKPSDPLADVRAALDRLRRQNGVQAGDAFDHILRTVEALAVSMAALSVNAARVVEEGQRQVGAVVSAAMTRQALWRLAVLPAGISGAVAVLGCCGLFALIMHDVGVQRSTDRAAFATEFDRLLAERAAFRNEIAQERADLAVEKANIEANLPALLIARADHLAAAARELVHSEAESPGFISWLAQNGRGAMVLWRANNGTLCPRTTYDGPTPMCMYPKP